MTKKQNAPATVSNSDSDIFRIWLNTAGSAFCKIYLVRDLLACGRQERKQKQKEEARLRRLHNLRSLSFLRMPLHPRAPSVVINDLFVIRHSKLLIVIRTNTKGSDRTGSQQSNRSSGQARNREQRTFSPSQTLPGDRARTSQRRLT